MAKNKPGALSDFVGADSPDVVQVTPTDATPPAGLGGDSNLPDEKYGAAYRVSSTRIMDASTHFQPTHSTLLHAQNGDPNSMDVAAGRTNPHQNPTCPNCGGYGHGRCM